MDNDQIKIERIDSANATMNVKIGGEWKKFLVARSVECQHR